MSLKQLTSLWVIASTLFLSSCDDDDKKEMLYGVIDQTQSEFSYNEFTATEDTWMKITIEKLPRGFADHPSQLVYEQTIHNKIALPFSYQLSEVTPEMFDFEAYTYLLYCSIFLGEEEGSFVGDLVSEIWTEINDLSVSNNIEVFGLEHCDSSYAGGNCSTEFRQ